MSKDKIEKHISLRNKKATFEYALSTTYVAGIALKGTEIKSIRQSKVSFQDSFCLFIEGELFVRNLHIAEYDKGTIFNHSPKRDRKLLLKKTELKKLVSKVEEAGYTIVPTKIFINDRGLAKMEIALAKGKKLYDKRESIKERDVKRSMDRDDY